MPENLGVKIFLFLLLLYGGYNVCSLCLTQIIRILKKIRNGD